MTTVPEDTRTPEGPSESPSHPGARATPRRRIDCDPSPGVPASPGPTGRGRGGGEPRYDGRGAPPESA
jgi:hypothetical protein